MTKILYWLKKVPLFYLTVCFVYCWHKDGISANPIMDITLLEPHYLLSHPRGKQLSSHVWWAKMTHDSVGSKVNVLHNSYREYICHKRKIHEYNIYVVYKWGRSNEAHIHKEYLLSRPNTEFYSWGKFHFFF